MPIIHPSVCHIKKLIDEIVHGRHLDYANLSTITKLRGNCKRSTDSILLSLLFIL